MQIEGVLRSLESNETPDRRKIAFDRGIARAEVLDIFLVLFLMLLLNVLGASRNYDFSLAENPLGLIFAF